MGSAFAKMNHRDNNIRGCIQVDTPKYISIFRDQIAGRYLPAVNQTVGVLNLCQLPLYRAHSVIDLLLGVRVKRIDKEGRSFHVPSQEYPGMSDWFRAKYSRSLPLRCGLLQELWIRRSGRKFSARFLRILENANNSSLQVNISTFCL